MIYTASEPSGSMTWFPSTTTRPTRPPTGSNHRAGGPGRGLHGLLVDEVTEDGRTTYTWQMDDLMATYLAAVYIGEFERIDREPSYPDGPVIRDYVHSTAAPENRRGAGSHARCDSPSWKICWARTRSTPTDRS